MTLLKVLRDDSWRVCIARRFDASASSAKAFGRLTAALVAIALAVVGAELLGLSALPVVAIALFVAVGAVIAVRQTLGDLVAGLTLLLVRPYGPGEPVRLFVPSLQSFVDAEIVRVGIAVTTLATAGGLVAVPNSGMLRTGPYE